MKITVENKLLATSTSPFGDITQPSCYGGHHYHFMG